MRRAAVIYNPLAARLLRLREIVAAHETADGWAPTLWIPTTGAGPADALLDTALADRDICLVIAAGGDGTVRSIGAALAGSPAGRTVPFGIIPVGTANLLARNLGVPLRRLDRAVAIAFSGGERGLDLGRIDYTLADGSDHSRPYLVMAGFGVDSDMVAWTRPELKARLGWLAYVAPILRSVSRRSVGAVMYSLDGAASVIAPAHSFIVGNGGTITAGIRLMPTARLDDGMLDVLVLRSMRGLDRVGILRWLLPHNLPGLTGAEPAATGIHYAPARDIELVVEQPTIMQADGDLLGRVIRARFSVTPGALTVRAPVGASSRIPALR